MVEKYFALLWGEGQRKRERGFVGEITVIKMCLSMLVFVISSFLKIRDRHDSVPDSVLLRKPKVGAVRNFNIQSY